MNSHILSFLRVAAVAAVALVVASAAKAQSLYLVSKNQHFVQSGLNTVVADATGPFTFNASAPTSGSTLTIPGGASFSLVYYAPEDNYRVTRSFATKAALDAAFPAGTYTFAGAGRPTVTVAITADLYPPAPQVVGGTWNAGGTLLLAPSVATTINFNAFPGYATAGVGGTVYAEVSPYLGLPSPQVFSRAVAGLDLTVSALPLSSFAIPSGKLQNNSVFFGGIEYNTFTTLDPTSVPGSVVAVFFGTAVTYNVVAVSSGTGGNPPVITKQPADQSAAFGSSTTFTIAATTGAGGGLGPFFDWHFNGNYISTDGSNPKYSMASNGSLTVKNLAGSDAGNYAVQVSNAGGIVPSNVAVLTVTGLPAKPAIATAPQSQTLGVGQSATLSVAASGGSTNTYQWNKDGAAIVGATSSTLALTSVQASAAGSYTVTVSNESGVVTSNAAIIAVSTGPGLTTQPLSQDVAATTRVTLTVVASGSGVTYQWKKNGAAIAGATSATYVIASAQTSDMGFYSCTVTSGSSSTESATATVTVTGGAAARPVNISTRALVTTAEPLTAGFVLSASKTLLIRASGPALVQFGVPGTLADPKLEVIPLGGSTAVASNNDWGAVTNLAALNAAVAANGAFPFPAGSKDAAVLVTLPAGGYTARITGADGGSGIALVEVYDTDPLSSSGQLVNLSARATVGTGASNLATGFVVSGVAPRQVLIRAIGPALTAFGVAGALADPQLTVIPAGASYSVATNDNWGGVAALKAAFTATGAFPLDDSSKDAVVLLRLPPGGYTAVVAGVGSTTGTAIVEVYDLGP